MRPAIETAKNLFKENVIGVEIGVYLGIHALDILESIPVIKKLYLVDNLSDRHYRDRPQETKWIIQSRLFAHNDKVIYLWDSSGEASRFIPDGFLDFVYIDADHSHKNVLEDIRTWQNKLKPGGLLCGHDYDPKHPGVISAVKEFVQLSNDVGRGLELHCSGLEQKDKDWWVVMNKEVKENET